MKCVYLILLFIVCLVYNSEEHERQSNALVLQGGTILDQGPVIISLGTLYMIGKTQV